MSRKLFLSIASIIATAVGLFALFFPSILQESKGTLSNAATNVWTSEVGILLSTIGVMTFLLRREKNSKILRIFFVGMFIIQIGLFAIEFSAYLNGIITKLSGVLPNLVLHIVLATGFIYYLVQMIKNKQGAY